VKCSLTTHKNSLLFSIETMVRRTRQIVTLLFYVVSLATILVLRFYVMCLILGAFAKLPTITAPIIISFSRPHGTTRLPLEGFW